MTEDNFTILKRLAIKEISFSENIEEALVKASRLPNLYQKYLDVYISECRELNDLTLQLEKLYGERLEDIKTTSRIAWKNKEETDSQIVRNEVYSDLRVSKEKQAIIVQYLQETLSNINRMGFAIKNFIDIKKFMAGMG